MVTVKFYRSVYIASILDREKGDLDSDVHYLLLLLLLLTQSGQLYLFDRVGFHTGPQFEKHTLQITTNLGINDHAAKFVYRTLNTVDAYADTYRNCSYQLQLKVNYFERFSN